MFNSLHLRKSRSILAAAFLLISCQVSADNWAALTELDKIKTQNFEQFSSSLDEWLVKDTELNVKEQHYVKFLDLFRNVYLKGYTSVIDEIEQMLQQDLPLTLKFRLSALAVNAYQIKRDFRKAFLYADDILRTANEIDDAYTLRQVLAPMAHLYIDARQKDLAQFYIERLRAVTQQEDRACFADYLDFRLHIYFSSIDELSTHAQAAVNSCKDVGETLWQDLAYAQWAKAYLDNNQIDDAITLMDQFRASALASSYPVLVGSVYNVDANIALERKDYISAKRYLKLAFEKSASNESQELRMYLNETAYKIAFNEGNFEQALEYYKVFKQIANLLDKDRADKQLSYELVKSEIEVKNQRIELLNKDNELLYLQKNVYESEAKQNRLLVLVLASVLVLAIVMAYRGITGRRRFKRIAEYDHLTGISNRYHFNNQAQVALDYCESNAKPVALILFDLDFFKNINDTYGHAIGDWTLQQVVNTCRNFMRNNDVFGRIGGEEFVVVLPGCHTDKALLLAEICRDAIANIDTAVSGTEFALTASFGVTGADSSGYQLKQLLADADSAMYRAKEAGRNQVVSFAPEQE
ncbi:GGDEF domain-containing protein [Rheinheimera baltica]|uniref:diguanylate cyclase n=1 Tax=Rheinheimera baltica TaxID=67576 RepID=A0ABT9HX98_9GAMM|nr:GGDEF domain-containing protein [Rheinheimera baltica]MDP5135435.1 GGDEF domain-containing protein [Rheinheimera baltica]